MGNGYVRPINRGNTQRQRQANNVLQGNNALARLIGADGLIRVTHAGNSIILSIDVEALSPLVGSGGGGEGIETMVIIETLSYPSNNDVSYYTVAADNGSGTPTEMIDNVLGYPESSGGQDMRDFIPWLAEGTEVPVITIDSVKYFLQTFSYIGNEDARSLAWIEDEDIEENTPRAAAIFR